MKKTISCWISAFAGMTIEYCHAHNSKNTTQKITMQTSIQIARQIIYTLDLSDIIDHLIKINKWSKTYTLIACAQYKNYLFLKKKYGNQYTLPPSCEIDKVWHTHILHTQDYMNFCQAVFGEYLHHHPHHANNLSKADLQIMFKEQTQRLYYQEIGEPVYSVYYCLWRTRVRYCLHIFKLAKLIICPKTFNLSDLAYLF